MWIGIGGALPLTAGLSRNLESLTPAKSSKPLRCFAVSWSRARSQQIFAPIEAQARKIGAPGELLAYSVIRALTCRLAFSLSMEKSGAKYRPPFLTIRFLMRLRLPPDRQSFTASK